jgi:integrase/recombinase XerD
MLPTIILKPIIHKNAQQIGIYFKNELSLNIIIRKDAAGIWSQTKKCWYVPFKREAFEKLKTALKDQAVLEVGEIKKYLDAKKKESILDKLVNKKYSGDLQVPSTFSISPMNKHVLTTMKQMLKLKAFSSSTIKTYLSEMAQLLQTIKDIPADELKPDHLKRYLVYCYEKLGLKENTLHSRINAMKFYYEQVLKREKFFWEIPRPKKQLLLPRFFNQDEITAIIKAAGNIKHRTMLMLAYSSGMRVSEVVNIKTADIDSKRMCILVKQAKGKKDRMVTLSPVLLIMLREYWKKNKPFKQGFLFPGQNKDESYSPRSLQLVLAAAKKKAGILKPGSIHALRHSFATHLLDKGTDVVMIMKLLGHNDIKTTLRYLHVSNRDMLQVVSPLDDLKLD